MSVTQLTLGGAAMARCGTPGYSSNTLYVQIGFRLPSPSIAGTGSDMKLEGGCYCGKVRYAAEDQIERFSGYRGCAGPRSQGTSLARRWASILPTGANPTLID